MTKLPDGSPDLPHRAPPRRAKRWPWILAIAVAIVMGVGSIHAIKRATQLDDRSLWTPDRAMIARQGWQVRDDGSFEVTWTDDDGRLHEDRIVTTAAEARRIIENLGGTEIEVQVYQRAAGVVCPTTGFDTCVEHRKDLKGELMVIGGALALIGYALYRLITATRSRQAPR